MRQGIKGLVGLNFGSIVEIMKNELRCFKFFEHCKKVS